MWKTYLLCTKFLCYNENKSKPTTRNLTFSTNKTCCPCFWTYKHIWSFLLAIQARKNNREQRMVQNDQVWNTNQINRRKIGMRVRNMLPILRISWYNLPWFVELDIVLFSALPFKTSFNILQIFFYGNNFMLGPIKKRFTCLWK